MKEISIAFDVRPPSRAMEARSTDFARHSDEVSFS